MTQPTESEPRRSQWSREEPIRLGVSSCLLGAEVRYDGGHKHNRYLAEVVGDFFEWVLVCPELEIGLGVPRPPIRLVHGGDNPRLVEPNSGEDLTQQMESYARDAVTRLKKVGLDGFILKASSPSCGVEGVEVVENDGPNLRNGVGIFARVLIQQWPDLPVAEEGWLEDPDRRTIFFEQVLRRHRERIGAQLDLDPDRLTELDAAHRLLLERLRVES